MFFITTLHVNENQEFGAIRCVGYFANYEEAKDSVLKNSCDLFEKLYNYIVIEEISEGLYEFDLNPHWFHISEDGESYYEIEKPKFAENYFGFAIG